MVELSAQDYEQLQAEGYSPHQIQAAVAEVTAEEQGENYGSTLQAEYRRTMGNQSSQFTNTPSAFQFNPTDNLIKWQLELNDILERAEHILREDIVSIENGNTVYKSNPDKNRLIFSEYGVQEIMRILSMYINRNTILSDYEPDEISDKVHDFGIELNNLFFSKYEDIFNFPSFTECIKILKERYEERKKNTAMIFKEFEIDVDEGILLEIEGAIKFRQGILNEVERVKAEIMLSKRKHYPMLVREIVDLVHSAYKRAMYGGERDSLRTARQFTQSEQIVPQGINIHTGEARRERGVLNPMRLILGKYK